MCNLIEYSDNYSDSTASLYQFKIQEPLDNNADLAIEGSSSFKYKSNLLGNASGEGRTAVWKNVKIIVPLKYISSFFRSLEIPLINTKLYIELNYSKNSIISNVEGDSTFKITKTELHVPVVTLQKAKFEYSPLGQVFNKGLDSNERQEGLLNRLKNIEDKTDNQLKAIEDQGIKQ